MRFIRRGGIGAAAAATLLLAGSRLMAQERDTTEVARLRAQIEAITREIEELKLGREVVARADTGGFGLGPAARPAGIARTRTARASPTMIPHLARTLRLFVSFFFMTASPF